ncbi:MAG: hypothetical protein HXX17_10545 [Geobacteraceae bacterium]|nr:hypothetical protein [Geobacteraceae bacterium]
MGQQEEAAINDSPLFRASQNPLIAFELTPNIRNSYIRINSDGFRGPDYSFVVPAGRRRIAVLGDSETFGMSMPEEATLPGKLQILLNSRSVEPFEVLNFGVPAYNSIQELQILEAKVLKYNPEIVILYYNFNDPIISPRSMLISRTVFHKLFLVSFVDWALSRRKTANEIGEHYSKIVLQGSTDADSMVDFYLALHKGSYFETTKSLLKKMAKISKQHGSRFILVIAPELYDFDDFSKYPYRSIHAALKALVSPEIEVVDPLDDVIALGKKPGDLWVSNTDPHKNQEAQASVAKAITRYLNNTK